MLRKTQSRMGGMKFSQSKNELRWKLRNDSLVLDLMKIKSRTMLNAIAAAGKRP